MQSYSFSSLVGNSTTLLLLQRALQRKTFSRFTCFEGILGTGKSTSARIAALSLTCEHLVEGQPCLKCTTCQSNIRAFDGNGESMYVKIVNMGIMSRKDDINSLIQDVFVLRSGHSNKVYIFEEAHALRDVQGAQTALLEELDRMPLNTYIIMCTTKSSDLLPELRSRATSFHFGRLNHKEAAMLLYSYSMRNYNQEMPVNIQKMLISSARGIPRDLIKLLDFVVSTEVTEEELRDYLCEISDAEFIALFQSMISSDVKECLLLVTDMLASKDPALIVDKLKAFVLKALFLLEGAINDGFSNSEKSSIREIFDSNTLMQIASSLERYGRNTDENTLKLSLLKIRLLFEKRTLSDVYVEKNRIGVFEKTQTEELTQTLQTLENSVDAVHLSKLSLGKIDSFGGQK